MVNTVKMNVTVSCVLECNLCFGKMNEKTNPFYTRECNFKPGKNRSRKALCHTIQNVRIKKA